MDESGSDSESSDLSHDSPGKRFKLRLFDGFNLEQDGRALRILHSARRLIAYLGIRGRVERSVVSGTLWPEVPDPKAQASLRTTLWRLRQLTSDPVVIGRETLSLAGTVDADVPTFVAAARRTVDQDGGTPAGRVITINLPLTGELLPGWYDDWVLAERERLRQLQLHALEAIAAQLTAAGRYAQAIEAALAAVRLEPLREGGTRALIAAHLAENNVVEAVRCYQAFRGNLHSELGVRPSPELERLVHSHLHR